MKKSTLKALDEYDLYALSHLEKNWEALSFEDKFFCIWAHTNLRDLEKAKVLIQSSKELFIEKKVYGFLMLECVQTSQDKMSMYFHKFVSSGECQVHPAVKAFLKFSLGFFFLTRGQYVYAKPFYQESIELFESLNLKSFVWRGNFNLMLCDTINLQVADMEASFNHLLNDFEDLPFQAKLHFTKFIVWMQMYLGNLEQALSEVEKYCNRAVEKEHNLEHADLLKYKVYLNHFLHKKDSFSFKGHHDFYFSEMFFLTQMVQESYFVIMERIKLWSEKLDFVDYFMIVACLLRQFYVDGKYSLLLRVYSSNDFGLELMKSSVIPPEDLAFYPSMAALMLGKTRVSKKLERMHSENTSSFQQKRLEKALLSLKLKMSSKTILLKFLSREVLIEGKIYDFTKKRRSFLLLFLLMKSASSGVSLKNLHREMYGEALNEVGKMRIRTLIRRANRYFDFEEDIIIEMSEMVFLSKKFKWKIEKKPIEKKEERRRRIIRIAMDRKNGVTAKDLAQELEVSSRTVVSDIDSLLKEKKLFKSGKTRKLRYYIQKV